MTRDAPSIKTTFLHLLVGSIAILAALGIATILWGRFGWIEIRVLLTTLTVAVASVFGLACGASLDQHSGRALPMAGIALTLLSALLIIAGMWIDVDDSLYWRTAITIGIFGASCAHTSLLSMAVLAPRFEWTYFVTYGSILIVALLATLIVVFEIDGSPIVRSLGVMAIVDGAMTVTTPILHRLSRPEAAAAAAATGPEDLDREIATLEARLADLRKRRQAAERAVR